MNFDAASAFTSRRLKPLIIFFYGLRPGEEVAGSIEVGKILIIKLINIGPPTKTDAE